MKKVVWTTDKAVTGAANINKLRKSILRININYADKISSQYNFSDEKEKYKILFSLFDQRGMDGIVESLRLLDEELENIADELVNEKGGK